MSYKTVVVIGAGPIGMLAAIEAKRHFKRVVMIEKREEYTRKNVPTINRDTGMRQHVTALSQTRNRLLRRQAADTKLWGDDLTGKDVPLSQLEEALLRKARAVSISVKRGYVLTGIVGNDKKDNGRYKTITLTYRAYDPDTRQPTGPALTQNADLLVLALGGGASSDPLVTGTLGFDYEKLEAKNYGAYATYQSERIDRGSRDMSRYRKAKEVSETNTMVPGDTHNYLLSTLENCTEADFELLRTQTPVLKSMMEEMGKQFGQGRTEHINEGLKDLGVFTIQLQRARQFMSAEYPAVMVGDAACQPHPAAGSGIACGFQGFEQLKTLYEALAEVHRSNDNGQAFGDFNGHMEPIVARKALEGTKWVTLEVRRLLEKHQAEVEGLKQRLAGPDKPNTTRLFDAYIEQSGVLINRMIDHRDDATKLYEARQHETRYAASASPVTALWADVDETYLFVKAATEEYSTLARRVQQMAPAAH